MDWLALFEGSDVCFAPGPLSRKATAHPHNADMVIRVPALVVAFDDRDLDAQQAALARLAVEKAHGRPGNDE